MSKTKDLFGINMVNYCKEHELYICQQLSFGANPEKLLKYHIKKIEWLQHERLVHLLVTMLTAILFLFLFGLDILNGSVPVLILLAGVSFLLAAYIFHYFRLENTVQHWYKIADSIYHKINEP